MGNGYPISVVLRARGHHAQLGNGVVHGGTFTCHSVALAAAEKMLEILDETPALADIAAYGTRLRTGMSQVLVAARHRAPLQRPSVDERPVLQRDSRRATTATGRAAITLSTRRWPRSCTTSACSSNRTRASRGSSARRTTAVPRRDAGALRDGGRHASWTVTRRDRGRRTAGNAGDASNV